MVILTRIPYSINIEYSFIQMMYDTWLFGLTELKLDILSHV